MSFCPPPLSLPHFCWAVFVSTLFSECCMCSLCNGNQMACEAGSSELATEVLSFASFQLLSSVPPALLTSRHLYGQIEPMATCSDLLLLPPWSLSPFPLFFPYPHQSSKSGWPLARCQSKTLITTILQASFALTMEEAAVAESLKAIFHWKLLSHSL